MNCDEELLQTLVEQSSDPTSGFDKIAEHIEHCLVCQNTLTSLGGETAEWNDTRHWLEEIAQSLDASDDKGELDDEFQPSMPIDLTFLEESSHPEMLGRIGRYEIEAVLGRGGMGVVFRAHDVDLHRSVAVKVMAPEWAASAPARRRFAREAQAAASVAHENVIPIYNVESDARLPYLVMRYVPGMTLQRLLDTQGALDSATLLRVAGQLAEGLAAAHRRGLVHRDIKPANVMVGEDNNRVWITDFGLARAADSVTLTQTGVIAGTPHYMSPEQVRGESVDQGSDLFSLGCVFYFLATGKPPFEAENTLAVLHRIVSDKATHLAEQRGDLPPAFVDLVQKLLHPKRSKRPKNCEEIIKSLSIAQAQIEKGHVAKPPMGLKMIRPICAATICVLMIAASVYFYCNSEIQANHASLWKGGQYSLPQDTDHAATSALPISAETVAAAIRIEQSLVRDEWMFESQVRTVEEKIDRIQREPIFESLFDASTSDSQWERELQKVKASIVAVSQSD